MNEEKEDNGNSSSVIGYSFRIESDLVERAKARAAELNLSVSGLIRVALEVYLNFKLTPWTPAIKIVEQFNDAGESAEKMDTKEYPKIFDSIAENQIAQYELLQNISEKSSYLEKMMFYIEKISNDIVVSNSVLSENLKKLSKE